jgi:hypothetical protein
MGVANEVETPSDNSSDRSLGLLIATGCEGEAMNKMVKLGA